MASHRFAGRSRKLRSMINTYTPRDLDDKLPSQVGTAQQDTLTSLPREMRDMIYTNALVASNPIKRRQSTLHAVAPTNKNAKPQLDPIPGLSLLRVNRQIGEEALHILYEVNVVRATRGDFCRRLVVAKNLTQPDLKLLVRLDLSGFHMSAMCTANMYATCGVCVSTPCKLLTVLGAAPRLQSVVVDYGISKASCQAFALFRKHIRSGTVGYKGQYRMICTGVGHFTLTYRDRPSLTFTFRNTSLTTPWQHHVTTGGADKRFADRASIFGIFGIFDHQHAELPYSEHVAQATKALFFMHDPNPFPLPVADKDNNKIPSSFAKIWPKNLPVDLRKLGEPHTRKFLWEMSVAIEDYVLDVKMWNGKQEWHLRNFRWEQKW